MGVTKFGRRLLGQGDKGVERGALFGVNTEGGPELGNIPFGLLSGLRDLPQNAYTSARETLTNPDILSDPDVGMHGLNMAGALAPGFGRAVSGSAVASLGAAGGQPPKITALISAMRGHPEFEALATKIYENLNDIRKTDVAPSIRTAASLAKDTPEWPAIAKLARQTDAEQLVDIAEQAAAHQIYSKLLGKDQDFELGAAGGANKLKIMGPGMPTGAVNDPVTLDKLTALAKQMGLQMEVQRTGGGTVYAKLWDPRNPPRNASETPTIRIPDDNHIGRPASGSEVGNRYETGTQPELTGGRRMPVDTRIMQNAAGEPFGDMQALTDVLRWRFGPDKGGLVSPDVAPAAQYKGPLPNPQQPQPKPDPRQLKLLSSGAGRFAAPDLPPEMQPDSGVSEVAKTPQADTEPDLRAGRYASAVLGQRAEETEPRGMTSFGPMLMFNDPQGEEAYRSATATVPDMEADKPAPAARVKGDVTRIDDPDHIWEMFPVVPEWAKGPRAS